MRGIIQFLQFCAISAAVIKKRYLHLPLAGLHVGNTFGCTYILIYCTLGLVYKKREGCLASEVRCSAEKSTDIIYHA